MPLADGALLEGVFLTTEPAVNALVYFRFVDSTRSLVGIQKALR
jgi:hypothetical protein